MFGDLPPSSRQTRLTVSAAAAPTCAGPGGPGEGDHVDAGVAGQGVADVAAGAVDQVEDTRRHVGCVHDLRQQCAAGGGIHARFGDHRASGGQGVDHLDDGGLDRPVPGRDQSTHADRLAAHNGASDRDSKGYVRRISRATRMWSAGPGNLGAAAHRNADFTSNQLRKVDHQRS